ncbi:MAG: dockerin type I repeat-containing protein [Clostridia bacterium]|nr:dockerin type I repeat-containing protein [Clostridia bacterium]
MKKFIALLVSVIMILGIMPLAVSAATELSIVHIGDIASPVAGQTPDFVATYGSGYNFTTVFDVGETYYGITWIDTTDGDKNMTSEDVFEPGHIYRVAVVVAAQPGYSFSKYDNYTSSVSCRINGKTANVYVISGYNAGEYIGITYTFEACAYNLVTSVAVTDLDVPASGEKFDFTATPADKGYFVNSIYWKDVTVNKNMNENDVAIAGHEYEVEIWLRVNDAYRLKVDGDGCPDVTAKIGAYNATVITSVSDVAVGITDNYIVPDDITTVTVSGVDAPVTGATADTEASCGSGYQITEIVWVDTTGEYKDYVYGITEFEADREYTVQVTLTTIGNYRFIMDGPYNDVSGKINNNSATVYGSHSATEVTIGYEFPATEKAANIIIDKVYVNDIDAPEYGKAPDTEGTCGEGYEITEIVWVDTTGEYKDYVYGITEFEAGHEYTVQITLKVKDGYEYVSDGYYNEVTAEINMQPAIEYGTSSVTELAIGYEFPAVTAPEHTHEYKAVVTAPTCTAKGYTTYTCACGDTYTADETEMVAHTPEIIPGKAATETEAGLTEGEKCSVCGTVTKEQEVIPADHVHDYVAVVTAPTCTAKGYTTYTCACGDTYTADETEATGHDYGDWEVIKKAEVGVEGKEQRKCKSCGSTEERTIPALENPDEDILLGDVNKDGKITAADARLALRIAAKIDTPDDYQKVAANYNKDDKITAADARLILRKAARID